MNLLRSRAWSITLLYVLFFVLMTSLLSGYFATQKPVTFHILGVNDFHGQLTRISTYNGKSVGSAPYLASHILTRKKKDPEHTFLVHAGDMVGASEAVSALLQDEPTMEVLNTIGFDIGIPGNHEFDEGPKEMMRLIKGGSHKSTGHFSGANFPYICSNVVDKKTNKLLLPPSIIKEVDGIKIAFIGVATKDTPITTFPGAVDNLTFLDEVDAIENEIKNVKKEGVHSVVVIAHEGGIESKDHKELKGRITHIAEKLPSEVSTIIAGHTHHFNHYEVNGKLIVQAACYGTAFEDVTLTIDPNSGEVLSKKAEFVHTYHEEIIPNPKVASIVEAAKKKSAPIFNKVVSHSKKEIGREENDRGESQLGLFLADAQRKKMKSEIALVNPFGIRSDIPSGAITWGDLYNIQPHSNSLFKVRFTGKQIYQILNQQFTNDYREQLLHPSGISYTYDLHRPQGKQIVKITMDDGTPLDLEKSYTVTINSFLVSGGDGFTLLKEGEKLEEGPLDIDALIYYVKKLPQPFLFERKARIFKG